MRSKSRQLSLDKTGSLFGSPSGLWSFALNILARRSIIFGNSVPPFP